MVSLDDVMAWDKRSRIMLFNLHLDYKMSRIINLFWRWKITFVHHHRTIVIWLERSMVTESHGLQYGYFQHGFISGHSQVLVVLCCLYLMKKPLLSSTMCFIIICIVCDCPFMWKDQRSSFSDLVSSYTWPCFYSFIHFLVLLIPHTCEKMTRVSRGGSPSQFPVVSEISEIAPSYLEIQTTGFWDGSLLRTDRSWIPRD